MATMISMLKDFDEALQSGDELKLRQIVGEIADINTCSETYYNPQLSADEGAETLLMMAAQKGKNELIKMILKRGASINQYNGLGETALIYAARSGHLEVVQTLLNANADINHRSYGGTALTIASRNRNADMVKLLIRYGASKTIRDRNNLTIMDYNLDADIMALLKEGSQSH